MNKIILEAPVFTLEAALKAAEAGVHRLELCADFGEGGVTPSLGMLSFLKGKIDIPIYVMIRPRGGDFVYSSEELYVMRKDITILRQSGADGFVFGVLNASGQVEVDACKRLLQAAEDLPCTFHRAFDVCADRKLALEAIMQCGFQRLLTSGGEPNVELGLANILDLMRASQGKLTVMPGGGLQLHHVEALMQTGFLSEIHASCKAYRLTSSEFKHPTVSLSNDPAMEGKVLTVDPDLVKAFLNLINS
jgi:copper homeostasis protein